MRSGEGNNPLDLNNLPAAEDYTIRNGDALITIQHLTSSWDDTSSSSAAARGGGYLSGKKSGGGGSGKKVYECRFCSLKFSKSQALGGHMNRHRQERETETLNKARHLVFANDLAPVHLAGFLGGVSNNGQHINPRGGGYNQAAASSSNNIMTSSSDNTTSSSVLLQQQQQPPPLRSSMHHMFPAPHLLSFPSQYTSAPPPPTKDCYLGHVPSNEQANHHYSAGAWVFK